MAKANVILQNSILWNLREVTKLSEKIKKRCGDVDCASWRYPTTNCNELEIFKLLQSNRNLDNYTYVLELTYDRLLYVLNLMIKYMETHESLEKFRPKKNVHRPKTLSLASVLHMIWDRIQAQWESQAEIDSLEKIEVPDNEKSFDGSLNVTKSSTCTQSEICAISLCSCCEMVQKFVTQLVLDMENIVQVQDFNSAIVEERKLMKEYLVELTSWSAMSRWLTAILKDFSVLAEKAEQASFCSRKLKTKLESGEQSLKTRLEQYIEETRKLESRIKEYESNSQKMKQALEELLKEKKHLNEELKMKTLQIETNARNSDNKIAEMKRTYESKLKEKVEKKLKKEKEKEEEAKKKCEAKNKEIEEVRNELQTMKKTHEETIAELRKEVESLNLKREEEGGRMRNREKDLEMEMENLKKENGELKKVLEEKQKILEDYSVRLLEAYPELDGNSKPNYIASGVPEIDMANQMEANTLRINRLQSENETLQKTLDKIKSLKG